jgi:hypothetical protein
MFRPIPPERLQTYAKRAATAELLDRVTVLRGAMENEAVDVFLAELAKRGLGPEEVLQHDRAYRHRALQQTDGTPATCARCHRAAVAEREGWHKLWGLLPLCRRKQFLCEDHAGPKKT